MKKILLIITSRFPFPPLGGDRLKTFNILKILSKTYDINLISLEDEKLEKNYEDFSNQYCQKYKIFIKSKYQSYFNLIKSLYIRKPLNVQYYYFKDVQDYVNEQLKYCDFAISISTKTSEYLINSNIIKYLDIVDSRALNYQRSKKNTLSFFWKILYAFDEKKMFEYEKKCIETFNNTFFVNKDEANYWSQFGNTTWIPNGVNEKLFNYNKKIEKYENYIAFFGRMDYQPNIDAIIWFINNVFDKLNTNIKLVIIGLEPTKIIQNSANNRIEVTGFMDDPYEILNSCFAIIAPMQSGGGIQNKILETMALEKINITTSMGAKAIIGAKHDMHLLISNIPDEMADLINNVYINKNKFNYMENNAKLLIRKFYTWEKYEKQLIGMISINIKKEEN